ncbi:MAG: serine/threonine-protein kinase [bacterium]
MIPEWFPSSEIEALRRFTDFHKLAEGSYGEVFQASCQEANAPPVPVIVKRLKPAYAIAEGKPREIFLHEAEVLKGLRHPQIPRYIDGYASSRECFFIMEFKEGHSVAHLLRNARLSQKTVSKPLSFRILLDVLDVLHYLHSVSLLHSDIKPENILVSPDLKSHLLDFSMAVPLQGPAKFLGGTKRYLPPENFLQSQPQAQSDLFSVAGVWFDLLALRPLHRGVRSDYEIFMRLLTGQHLKTVEKQGFPKKIEDILMRALAYRPEERFASARQFRDAVQRCGVELGFLPGDDAALRQEWARLGKPTTW